MKKLMGEGPPCLRLGPGAAIPPALSLLVRVDLRAFPKCEGSALVPWKIRSTCLLTLLFSSSLPRQSCLGKRHPQDRAEESGWEGRSERHFLRVSCQPCQARVPQSGPCMKPTGSVH